MLKTIVRWLDALIPDNKKREPLLGSRFLLYQDSSSVFSLFYNTIAAIQPNISNGIL